MHFFKRTCVVQKIGVFPCAAMTAASLAWVLGKAARKRCSLVTKPHVSSASSRLSNLRRFQQFNGKGGALEHFGLAFFEQQPSNGWSARHERLALWRQHIHKIHN